MLWVRGWTLTLSLFFSPEVEVYRSLRVRGLESRGWGPGLRDLGVVTLLLGFRFQGLRG